MSWVILPVAQVRLSSDWQASKLLRSHAGLVSVLSIVACFLQLGENLDEMKIVMLTGC